MDYNEFLEKQNALETALILFDWDNETLAPEKASERTSKTVGTLSALYQELYTKKETGEMLSEMGKKTDLTFVEKAVIRQIEKKRAKLERIPPEEYRRFSELTSLSVNKWIQAKKTGDFQKFAPVLSEIIETKKKFASYQGGKDENIYDILLSEYEEDFTVEVLDLSLIHI